jgi:hypothetical protein
LGALLPTSLPAAGAMAPKKKAKSRCKPPPLPKKAAAAKSRAVPTSLLERHESEEKPSRMVLSKSKSLTEDAKSLKVTKSNMKGFAPALIFEKKINCKTCLETVKEDRTNGVSMGKSYWDTMRDLYADDSSPSKRIKVANEAETLMRPLEVALLASLDEKKDLGPLEDFFENGTKVTNQKSFAVMLKHMAKVPPLCPPRNTALHLSCMTYISKHNLHVDYPVEFEQMRAICDVVLGKTFSSYKNSKLSAKLWWQGHHHVGKLLIPMDAMDKCCQVQASGSWEEVEAELYAVVRSSETGAHVLGFALRKMQKHKVQLRIDSQLVDLLAVDITEATVATNKNGFTEELQRQAIDPFLIGSPYKMVCDYRGVALEFTVRSPMDHYLTSQACCLHAAAADKGIIPALGCESQLVASGRPAPAIAIAASLLAPTTRARETANTMLESVEDESGPSVLALLQTKFQILYGLDKKWCVEFAFMEANVGEKGEKRLRELTLEALPAVGAMLSLDDSYTKLENISKTKLLTFCGAGLGHVFHSIKDLVATIRSGRKPTFSTGVATPFFNSIRDRLGLFLTFETPANAAAAANVVYGREACQQHFLRIKALVDAVDPDMCMQKLTPLQIYEWLLTAGELKLVHTWTEAEYAKGSRDATVALGVKGASKGGRKRTSADARTKLDALMKQS